MSVKLSDDMRMVEFFRCKIKKPTLDAGYARKIWKTAVITVDGYAG